MSNEKHRFWVIDPFHELVAGFKTEKEAVEHAKSEARMTPGCPFLITEAYKMAKTNSPRASVYSLPKGKKT